MTIFRAAALLPFLTVTVLTSAQDSLADRARKIRKAQPMTEVSRPALGVRFTAPEKYTWSTISLPDATLTTICSQEINTCRIEIRSFPLAAGRSDVSENDVRRWRPEWFASGQTVESQKPITVGGRAGYEVITTANSDSARKSRHVLIAAPETHRIYDIGLNAEAREERNLYQHAQSDFQGIVDSFVPEGSVSGRNYSPGEQKVFHAFIGFVMADAFFEASNKKHASLEDLRGMTNAKEGEKLLECCTTTITGEGPNWRLSMTSKAPGDGGFVYDGTNVSYKSKSGVLSILGDAAEIAQNYIFR